MRSRRRRWSDFVSFCSQPRAVIEKNAATVPMYQFANPKVVGKLVGADLDGNGKVDLVSYADANTLQAYEAIHNAGELNNGMWKPAGSIAKQELITLREECGDGAKHRLSSLWPAGGIIFGTGTLVFYSGVLGAPIAAPIMVGAFAVGAVAGVAMAVAMVINDSASVEASHAVGNLMQQAMVAAGIKESPAQN